VDFKFLIMPFFPNDFHCSGGPVGLENYWTPDVFKFDTSTFYNWEQDNEPIYDLEERTKHLWERAGYSTSTVTGVSLIVSANTPGAAPNHRNHYTTLSGAIESLPDTIRYPIRIEVCTSSLTADSSAGDIGFLHLKNIKFTDSGALEIINRWFAKPLSYAPAGNAYTLATATTQTSSIGTFVSADVSAVIQDTSCVAVSSNLSKNKNSLRDTWQGSNRIFLQIPEFNGNSDKIASKGLTVGVNCHKLFSAASTASSFNLNPHIYGIGNTASYSNPDSTMMTHDVSVLHGGTDGVHHRYSRDGFQPVPTGTSAKITGLMYANHLKKVKIENCNGPIYIRNFCVDGGFHDNGVASHSTKTGFEINNSNVVLENCAAMRCKQAGAEFNNSKVTLSRGFITYRNYETSSTLRDGMTIGAGLRANNSEVTLDVLARDELKDNREVAYGIDSPMVAAFNDVGWEFNNSILKGGRNRGQAFASSGTFPTYDLDGNEAYRMLYFYANNNKTGILANNSLLDTKARYVVFNNHVGIDGNNSQLKLREFTIDHNGVGFKLDNSKAVYNPDLWGLTDGNTLTELDVAQFVCSGNGQHLVLDNNSAMVPKYAASSLPLGAMPYPAGANYPGPSAGMKIGMGEMYGKFKLLESHGAVRIGPSNRISLPGVEVMNGSKLDLIHSRSTTEYGTDFSIANTGDGIPQSAAVYGSNYSVRNNSYLRLSGSRNVPTHVLGPHDIGDDVVPKKVAGIYVDNSSKALFCGPTIMAQHGINVLADNNSTIEFTPHQHENSKIYDPSGWQLSDPGNHTKVELQSYRACLVADNNSHIIMEDLGDYHKYWPVSASVNADYNATDDLGSSANCVSGYMQFYPNPQSTVHTISVPKNVGLTSDTASSLIAGGPIGTEALHRTMSLGGTCLRAVNGSKVNVMNVHFPAGWANASAVFYDASDTCGRLYIWNIDDTSYLKASYTTVSAVYPGYSPYNGPSSLYAYTEGHAVSGAPSSTPDTSTISVLDSFGASGTTQGPDNLQAGCARGVYGKNGFQNRGPFRLFFSPRGPSKLLAYTISGEGDFQTLNYGAPYQTLAQGYNLSGDVSAFGFDLSTTTGESAWGLSHTAIYQNLYPANKGLHGTFAGAPSGPGGGGARYGGDYTRNSAASSFFYPSEVLDPGYKHRIILDDAAMNTFANAKNATTGTSGRPVLVTYYRALKTAQGEGYDSNVVGFGIGFMSAGEFDLRRDN